MSVSTIPVDLPAFLREQMAAAQEAGFYSSEVELVTDAVRTLLAARPDLRLATACQLYARGTVSLGRGAELAGLDVVRFKRTLHERGISRIARVTNRNYRDGPDYVKGRRTPGIACRPSFWIPTSSARSSRFTAVI